MDDDVVVFLGPTLPREQAKDLLPAIYAPPAEQGHIVEIVQSMRPRIIVLIDGVFGSVPSVRHKEILWALSQGVEVFGASSIGALRAAELAGFGMRGYGLIYRWYRAVPFAEDDEVAVAMAPFELGAGAIGDALIDIRLTFSRAVRAGIIPVHLRGQLVEIARSTHFLERSYSHILASARADAAKPKISLLHDLEEWIKDHAVSQKRIDAVGLLRRLGGRADKHMGEERTAVPPFRLTEAFIRDLEDFGLDVSRLEAQRR